MHRATCFTVSRENDETASLPPSTVPWSRIQIPWSPADNRLWDESTMNDVKCWVTLRPLPFFIFIKGFKFRMEEFRLSSSFFLSLFNEHARARCIITEDIVSSLKFRETRNSCFLLLPSLSSLSPLLPLEEETNFFFLCWHKHRKNNYYNLRCCKESHPLLLFPPLSTFLLLPLIFLLRPPLRRFLSFEFQKRLWILISRSGKSACR